MAAVHGRPQIIRKFKTSSSVQLETGKHVKDIKSKGLDYRKVRFYFIDMLKALFYCHYVIKVIHRDIKPDNIVING